MWRFEKSVISMCSGSKQKPSEIGFIMGVEFEKQDSNIISIFLELSGFDDLIGFKSSVEEEWHDIDEASLWYGRRIRSKMMELKRTQPSWLLPCLEARVCWIIYWKLAVLMLTRLVVWMGFLHLILFLLWTLLFQLRLLSSCLMLLHFILSCCILLTMYSKACSFYSFF